MDLFASATVPFPCAAGEAIEWRWQPNYGRAKSFDDIFVRKVILGILMPLSKGGMAMLVRPEEVSNLVLFLASDESSFVSGAEHVVDGAMTAG